MQNKRALFVVGGPDAGKTNFIVRLWLSIHRGAGLVTPVGIPDELEYLQQGVENLLSGNFAPHTTSSAGEATHVEIPVARRDSPNDRGILLLPDADGELWLALYRNREWSGAWEDAAQALAGVLVFVRVDSEQNVAPLDWISAHQRFGRAVDLGDAPSRTPTQVLLTDWIQMIIAATAGRRQAPLRVAVVISAWDLVPADQQVLSPWTYLRDNYPMVEQFLRANRGILTSDVFGASVASGDFNDADFRKKYLSGDPLHAGYIVREAAGVVSRQDDVTLPVAWALGWAS